MTGDNTIDMQAETAPKARGHRLGDVEPPSAWVTHPINIRISIPFVHKRFYLTVVAGQERRRPDRLHQERAAYPLVTAGNVMFSLGMTTLLVIVALGLLIAQSAIIE